jgi:hypothetical protein
MNASEFLSQLWQRPARRAGRAPRKTQRLTGFEPLEPRTVLSASGMPMFAPDGFSGLPRNEAYGFAAAGRPFETEVDFPDHSERQPFGGDQHFSSPEYEAEDHDASILSHEYGDLDEYRQPLAIPASPAPSPSVSATAPSDQISTTITIVTTFTPSVASISPEQLYVVRTVGSPRVAADYGGSMNVGDIRYYAPVSIFIAERRLESQPYGSYSSQRESAGYVAQVRLGPSSALAAEADESLKSGEHLVSQHAATSPALSQLSNAQSTLTDRTVSPASDEMDRLDERPASSSQPGHPDGENDDGLIELQSTEASRQKRKSAANDSAARARISPRLERLAELPFAHSPQVAHDLRLADDHLAAMSAAIQQTSDTDGPDDGLVELLAVDVGTLMASSSAIAPVGAATTGTPVVALEAGVAFYQAFDIAVAEVVSGDTGPQDAPRLPDAPAAAQLARVE